MKKIIVFSVLIIVILICGCCAGSQIKMPTPKATITSTPTPFPTVSEKDLSYSRAQSSINLANSKYNDALYEFNSSFNALVSSHTQDPNDYKIWLLDNRYRMLELKEYSDNAVTDCDNCIKYLTPGNSEYTYIVNSKVSIKENSDELIKVYNNAVGLFNVDYGDKYGDISYV